MEYKGYKAVIEYDDDTAIFHGRIVDLPGVVTFEGTSVAELQDAMAESVEDYLEFCAKMNIPAGRSFSGKINLRLTSELHRALTRQAKARRQSLNQFVTETLTQVCREAI